MTLSLESRVLARTRTTVVQSLWLFITAEDSVETRPINKDNNESSDPCRTYTSDKLVKFWLGISISAYFRTAQTQPPIPKRKGQPGENKSGRYQCGRLKCKTSRANKSDIRRQWMLQHAPKLLKGPKDEESGTEPDDGDEESQKYVQANMSTWYAGISPAGLILLCEKVGVCCLGPTRRHLLEHV